MKTLIILNPNAGSGQARQIWPQIEAKANDLFNNPLLVITETPDDVRTAIAEAYAQGVRRVFAMGGDGTNHSLINALINLQETHPDWEPIVYGSLPVGTGRDWARYINMPLDPAAALDWLNTTPPQPVDVGKVTADGKTEYFLNIASSGLGGYVADSVNRLAKRYPWTFFRQSFEAILKFQPNPITVRVDGEEWYTGKAFIAVVANGGVFAHGMKIVPHAVDNDNQFEVLIIQDTSRLQVLSVLAMVYTGAHLRNPAVEYRQGQHVEIDGKGLTVGIEMDGETLNAEHITFAIEPHKVLMIR